MNEGVRHVSHLVCALGACVLLAALFTPLAHAGFDEYNFDTPENVGDLVFNFFHHSCGGDLLDNGLRSGLEGLGYTLHSRIDVQYEYENNNTDYCHWYKRFQRELGVEIGGTHYRYEGPGVTPTLEIPTDEFMLTWYEYRAERMDIIMFKPCYPGSDVSSYDTAYDAGGNVIGGTPYSDSGHAFSNFQYLNSTASVEADYTNDYWPAHGAWDRSLAQLKVAYRGMLSIFVEHPDLLFIAMQAPPMVGLSDDAAANCREFARWLREDWLHEYDPTGTDTFEDYPLANVCTFDFHNSVAWTGDDPVLDAEYAWFPVGGFPDDSLDTTNADLVGRNAGSEDHPEPWLDHRAAVIFCGGTDTWSQSHNPGHPQRSYYPWINAMVNRWQGGPSLLAPPSNLQLVADSPNRQIVLTWDDNSDGEDALIIQRNFNDGGWVNDYASVGPNTETYTDTDLAVGTYRYRVVAHLDDDGTGSPWNSAPSNTETAEIVLAEPPAAPSGLALSHDSHERSITLTWSDNSGNETGFIIRRNYNSAGWVDDYHTVPADTVSYTDTDLAPGQYSYRVVAYNEFGNSAPSNEETAQILDLPAAPSALVAVGDSLHSRITLNWTDESNNETGFRVQRSVGDDSSWDNNYATVGPDTTTFVDEGLGAGVYYYRVVAFNAAGDSNPSNVDFAVISASAPEAPSDLVSSVEGSDIVLGWSDNSDNEESFVVERSVGGGAFTVLDILPPDTDTFRDPGLSLGTYSYRVKARNDMGDSAYSNVVEETITEVSPTLYVDGSVADSGDGTPESPFKWIQEAIDAAAHGYTVIVAQGTYDENIDFGGKNIILRGTNPTNPSVVANTIINGNQAGSVVTFLGTELATCVLSGFTIRNGRVTDGNGGGICGGSWEDRSRVTIENNVITGNTAGWGGGLSYCGGEIRNNTISDNSVTGEFCSGGGLFECSGTILNNTISGNSAGEDGGGFAYCGATIQDNTITGNSAALGGGLLDCSGLIEDNVITDNSATDTGGGLAGCGGIIRNNIIACNTAANGGGGLNACSGTIQGNVIAENSAREGAGLLGCDLIIRNNTIVGNTAGNQGGGLLWCYGTIVNCVIWGNRATEGPQIHDSSDPTYSCIQDWDGAGEGNIDGDPGFVDADGPDADPATCEDNDYHLAAGSPCIDTGTNEDWMTEAVDLDGNPRVFNGTVDMGAYEYGAFAFMVTAIERVPGEGLELTWTSSPGETYAVWSRLDMLGGLWDQETTVPSQGYSTSWTDYGTTPSRKFYRIEGE